MAAKWFRAARFRFNSVDAVLPPPLPLINLPDEVRLANTGVPELRPAHLPVRRHIIESRCGGESVMREPEPVLIESRALVEMNAEEDEAREIVARVHVYEYNQPEVYQNAGASEDTLVFDSLFESGNLQRAERIYRDEVGKTAARRQEYELMIHPDIKNSAYRQWFYFEVRNGKPGITYKFSLTNLAKSGALFGSGLQPVVYSDIDASTKGIGWVHRGTNVRYDASLSADSASGITCLSFHYEFEHENDRVYFACLQPYTYTDLTEYLEAIERDPERAAVCRRTELCQTIAQNSCDLLTITLSGKDGISPEEKRVIVVSARVHPGEPNSSWMMKGMIDYLTGPSSGAQVLRRNFVFKIIPMLNPDGVINGNTRVNLAGCDLNRKWSFPVEKLFPSVYHLKRQIANFQTRDRVAVYCDLHGHSLNRNIFTYGCYNKKSGSKRSTSLATSVGNASSAVNVAPVSSNVRASVKNDPRVFPMVVAKNSQFFSFTSCDFKVHKSKLNTARVVVNHELGVINSYTLEASFCGPDFGPRKDTQFSTWDLEEMGESWCRSLLVYFDLVAEVKELDLLIAKQNGEAGGRVGQQPAELSRSPSANTGTNALSSSVESMSSSLLSDCEAAISELFASSVDIYDDVDESTSMDSDLSGAEDEPVPAPQETASAAQGASETDVDVQATPSPDPPARAIHVKKKVVRKKRRKRKGSTKKERSKSQTRAKKSATSSDSDEEEVREAAALTSS